MIILQSKGMVRRILRRLRRILQWYNDDDNYNKNNKKQQLYEVFANSCYKIVSPILLQKLINDFGICKHQKHFSGTLLLFEDVSHGIEN